MAPVQCKIFHDYAKETETHQYPRQVALSLLWLSELEQNASKVASNPGLLEGVFKVAASKTVVIVACANIQWTKHSFSLKVSANHGLPSGLFPERRQEDKSSHPWLSKSRKANPSSEQQGRHTNEELRAGDLGAKWLISKDEVVT